MTNNEAALETIRAEYRGAIVRYVRTGCDSDRNEVLRLQMIVMTARRCL